jgi:hypothetical protein
MIEIKIKVCNDEKSITKKHLIYDQDSPVSLCREDPTITLLVKDALEEFGDSSVDDVLLIAKMTW